MSRMGSPLSDCGARLHAREGCSEDVLDQRLEGKGGGRERGRNRRGNARELGIGVDLERVDDAGAFIETQVDAGIAVAIERAERRLRGRSQLALKLGGRCLVGAAGNTALPARPT